MNDQKNEIPDDLTIGDLVNFIMPYSKGFYTAEDYQNIINSPLSTMEKNSILYFIGFQVAQEEKHHQQMRQFIIQYEAKFLRRYQQKLMRNSSKRLSAAGRWTGKSIYWKAPIDMKQYELKHLDDSPYKQSHLKLLEAVHVHKRAYEEYHLATRQQLFKIGVKCFRALEQAGALIGDPAELATEYMVYMSAAPTIPEQVEQLTKNKVAVTAEQIHTTATLMDEIHTFSFCEEHSDKEKLVEMDKEHVHEDDHTSKPSAIRAITRNMKNNGMDEFSKKCLNGLSAVTEHIEAGRIQSGEVTQELMKLVAENKILPNWIPGGVLDDPAHNVDVAPEPDAPVPGSNSG